MGLRVELCGVNSKFQASGRLLKFGKSTSHLNIHYKLFYTWKQCSSTTKEKESMCDAG